MAACTHSHDKNKFRSEICLQLRKDVIIIMGNYCLRDTPLRIETHYRLTSEVKDRIRLPSPEGSNHLKPDWGHPECLRMKWKYQPLGSQE